MSPQGRAAVVLLLAMLYVLPLVAPFPLLDPDEGLHAAITQEMLARGDWVLPRFLGEPFLDKPILFFWAQAASFRAFGEHEAAARLPGLVFGALGALSTGWLAATMLGPRGWLAALLYTTMIVPVALMEVPVHDIAIVPFVNAALLAFWRAARAARHRQVLSWSAVAGMALGLAMLTKGLTGVAIVGLAHGTVLLLERRVRPVVIAGGILALALGVGIAAPWYIAVERTQPGYLHYYFVERHLFGFATGTQRHGTRSFFYYVPVLLAGGLPWILFTPFAARRFRPSSWPSLTPAQSDVVRLAGTWLMTGWLFLSVAGSKLFTYALPLFPAVALLALVGWTARREDVTRPSAFDRTVVVASVAGAASLALVVAALPRVVSAAPGAWTWAAASLVAVAWVVTAVAWTAGRRDHAAVLAPLAGAAVVVVLVLGVMPRVADVLSARDLAFALNRDAQLPPELWILRQRLGSVVFYLSRPLRAEATAERIRQVQLAELRSRAAPAGTRVAVAKRDWPKIAAFASRSAPFEDAGGWRLYRAQDLGVPVR